MCLGQIRSRKGRQSTAKKCVIIEYNTNIGQHGDYDYRLFSLTYAENYFIFTDVICSTCFKEQKKQRGYMRGPYHAAGNKS